MSGGHDAKDAHGKGGHEKKGPSVWTWVAAILVLIFGYKMIQAGFHHYGADRPAPEMTLSANLSSDYTHRYEVTVPGTVLGVDSPGTACYDKRFGPDEPLTRWINNRQYDSDTVIPFTATSILLRANPVDHDPYTKVLVEAWVAPPGYTCENYPKPPLQLMQP